MKALIRQAWGAGGKQRWTRRGIVRRLGASAFVAGRSALRFSLETAAVCGGASLRDRRAPAPALTARERDALLELQRLV